MYIKLQRWNDLPIWLNASLIVTIEPRRQGGSIVVPMGDGLDYEVKESPEAIIAMLEGAPAPTVIPVPVSDSLTKTPEDVSAEPEVMTAADAAEPVVAPAVEPTADAPAAKPRKRVTRAKTKSEADGASAPKKRASRAKAKKPELLLTEEQLARLIRMAPGSTRKLANTLLSQFKVLDAEGVIAALVDRGLVALDQDHVIWKQEPTA